MSLFRECFLNMFKVKLTSLICINTNFHQISQEDLNIEDNGPAKTVLNEKQRFNLLLLEPGEIYFEDFSVYYYKADLKEDEAIKRRQKGRLKICSKSVLFDPLDSAHPILKFLYKDITNVGKWSGSLLSRLEQIGEVIVLESKLCVSMKEGNVLAPYKYEKRTQKHFFSLNFGSANGILRQIEQLLRANSLNPHESAKMISTIVDSRQASMKFNTSWIEDLYEQIIYETAASKIAPLVCNPGRILLTTKQIYFQPFNNVESEPVVKVRLSDIKFITQRRYLLQHVGIEVFQLHGNDLYFIFSNSEERNTFYDFIVEQEELKLDLDKQENMTLKWQNGALSNFEYLTYLNSIADRSLNDLTQYPVFPWIIKDYTSKTLNLTDENTFRDLSKPIGALDEKRLAQLKKRCENMPEPKFLYGSHYSTPGFVLFYLVRVAPEYMLCLQNGKFDKADRLFQSMLPTWNNCCTGHSDYKELIPEFYNSDGSFLCNSYNLNLGRKQDGTIVHDVQLPPWAKDPEDFVNKCREALECDFVSNNIHNWIDLIFGYKQTGEEAWNADNVFYYLTYEGALDLESIDNDSERKCLEAQILEFGQTPKQLFTKPHPKRQTFSSDLYSPYYTDDSLNNATAQDSVDLIHIPVVKIEDTLNDLSAIKIFESSFSIATSFELKSSSKLHKEAVLGIQFFKQNDLIVSVSQDTQLKLSSSIHLEQQRSMNLSNMALSCCEVTADGCYVLVGSWDNNIYTYSVEFSRVVDKLQAHHDAVSSLSLVNNFLASSSWDSTVKIWKCDFSNKKVSFSLECEFDHDTEVTSCNLHANNDSYQLVAASKDGSVSLWNVESHMQLFQINMHTDAVMDILFSLDGSRVLAVCEDCSMKVLDIQTEVEVCVTNIAEQISCACWDDRIVILGSLSGDIIVWDLIKDACLNRLRFHQGAVRCLTFDEKRQIMCSGDENGYIAVWYCSL